jgi:hypothetical protein
MCYILLRTCSPPYAYTCAHVLDIQYTRCQHAATHSINPTLCPYGMRKRRISSGEICARCSVKRASLSLGPLPLPLSSCGVVMIARKKREVEIEGEDDDDDDVSKRTRKRVCGHLRRGVL